MDVKRGKIHNRVGSLQRHRLLFGCTAGGSLLLAKLVRGQLCPREIWMGESDRVHDLATPPPVFKCTHSLAGHRNRKLFGIRQRLRQEHRLVALALRCPPLILR